MRPVVHAAIIFLTATFMLAAQNTEKAKKHCENGRAAYLQFTLKELNRSVGHYEKALKEDSLYVPALAGLAQSLSLIGYETEKSGKSAGDYFVRALRYGEKAVATDSMSAHARRALAHAYMNADPGKYGEKAYDQLVEALSLDTTQAETFYLLWMHTKNDDPEHPLIKKALALDDAYFMSHYSAAVAYAKNKQFEPAIEHYKKCVNISPEHPMPYFGLGNAYSQLKKYKAAIREYDIAIDINPDFADSYLYAGLAHYYLGEDKLAVKRLEAYLKKAPESGYRQKVESILKEIKK